MFAKKTNMPRRHMSYSRCRKLSRKSPPRKGSSGRKLSRKAKKNFGRRRRSGDGSNGRRRSARTYRGFNTEFCTEDLSKAKVNPDLRMCLTSASFANVLFGDLQNNTLMQSLHSMLEEKVPRYSVLFILDSRSNEREHGFWEVFFRALYRNFEDRLVDMSAFSSKFSINCVWIKGKKLGCAVGHEAKESAIQDLVRKAHIIYGLGGDPCDLMKTLDPKNGEHMDVLNILNERVLSGNVVYMGRSAGSMIAGHKILSGDKECEGQFKFGTNFLPNVVIRPHVENDNYDALIETYCEAQREEFKRAIKALGNESYDIEQMKENFKTVVVKLQDDEFLEVKEGKIRKIKVTDTARVSPKIKELMSTVTETARVSPKIKQLMARFEPPNTTS